MVKNFFVGHLLSPGDSQYPAKEPHLGGYLFVQSPAFTIIQKNGHTYVVTSLIFVSIEITLFLNMGRIRWKIFLPLGFFFWLQLDTFELMQECKKIQLIWCYRLCMLNGMMECLIFRLSPYIKDFTYVSSLPYIQSFSYSNQDPFFSTTYFPTKLAILLSWYFQTPQVNLVSFSTVGFWWSWASGSFNFLTITFLEQLISTTSSSPSCFFVAATVSGHIAFLILPPPNKTSSKLFSQSILI